MEESIRWLYYSQTILMAMLVFIAFLQWRLQSKIKWLTGVVSSHSEVAIRLEAKKQGIPVFWHDPNMHKEGSPYHRKPLPLEEIKVGLPLKFRREPCLTKIMNVILGRGVRTYYK